MRKKTKVAKKKAAPRRKAASRKKRAPMRKTAPRKKRAARKKAAPRKKRAVRKAAPRKKAAPKKAAPSKKAAPKKAAPSKKAAPKKPAPKTPAPPPAFPQRAEASRKQLFLFELMRARATLLSAIQGVASGMSDPIAPGKWSPREIVLHVVARDQARLREVESTLRGTPHSWKGAQESDWARINEEHLALLRHHDWDEAVRLLNRTRQQLVEELESVPDEPSERWSPEHAFGAMLAGLPPHDRHHADQIKRWRASRGA
jgi:DinB family protein